jgi:hypothetical protein
VAPKPLNPTFNVDILRNIAQHLLKRRACKTLTSLGAAGHMTRDNLQLELYNIMMVKMAQRQERRKWDKFCETGNGQYVR